MLGWFPGLTGMCLGNFSSLASRVELSAEQNGHPDYIIRNATYFGPINLRVPQIAFLQDIHEVGSETRAQQLRVLNRATVVVANSRHTVAAYPDLTKPSIIPIGVDYTFFTPGPRRDDIPEGSVIYVGDSSINPKGFDSLRCLIDSNDLHYVLVMKDNFKWDGDPSRVTVFNRIDHYTLRDLYRSCVALVCTSREETQHLAGIEAMACNLPVVTTGVGIYKDLLGPWGIVESWVNLDVGLEEVINNRDHYHPRECTEMLLSKSACRREWARVIREATRENRWI